MNFVVYSHYFVPEIGAPSARIFDLAQQWLASGHTVEVVTCFPNHPAGRLYPGYRSGGYMHEKIQGIDVHRNWTYITPNKGLFKKTIGHLSLYPSACLLINRLVRKPDIAIGSSPTFFAAMAAQTAAWRHGAPSIMEVRDLWPSVFVELGVLRNPYLIRILELWELWLYRHATKVVTVTDAFRLNLIQRGVPVDKVFNVPNGADPEFWQPREASAALREKLGLRDNFTILYIGAHGISQALGRILESAAFLKSHPQIQFLFVGDGAEKEKLVQQAREQHLKNTHFLGPVEKESVRDLYALADLCLVPLRNTPIFDTFIPSKMFEMLAMARPIVASVRGEAATILNRSGGAVVVEPEDSRGIAETILELSRCPGRLDTMGECGRRFVIENYSRRALAKKYLEVIDAAIASHRRNRR